MEQLILANEVTQIDKKTLNFILVVAIVLLILFAAFGTLVKFIMDKQAERANRYMGNAYAGGVLASEKAYRKLGRKKNFRVLFKQSLIPFVCIVFGVLFWLVVGWIRGSRDTKILENCRDLFFIWDFKNQDYYTYVFGIKLLASWPELSNKPHIEVAHITSYIEAIIILTGIVWYVLACQAFIARAIYTDNKAKELFTIDQNQIKKERDSQAAVNSPAPPPLPID